MTQLGNILWLIFGGLIACVGYLLSGVLLCLTIIGIPFGIQSIKIGIATLAPFGKNVIEVPEANSTLRILFNVFWILFFGWELVVSLPFAACSAVCKPSARDTKLHHVRVPVGLTVVCPGCWRVPSRDEVA